MHSFGILSSQYGSTPQTLHVSGQFFSIYSLSFLQASGSFVTIEAHCFGLTSAQLPVGPIGTGFVVCCVLIDAVKGATGVGGDLIDEDFGVVVTLVDEDFGVVVSLIDEDFGAGEDSVDDDSGVDEDSVDDEFGVGDRVEEDSAGDNVERSPQRLQDI